MLSITVNEIPLHLICSKHPNSNVVSDISFFRKHSFAKSKSLPRLLIRQPPAHLVFPTRYRVRWPRNFVGWFLFLVVSTGSLALCMRSGDVYKTREGRRIFFICLTA